MARLNEAMKNLYLALVLFGLPSIHGFLTITAFKYSFLSTRLKVTIDRDDKSSIQNVYPRGDRSSARVRKIKELTRQKGVLNDITAAEFALSVESKGSVDSKIDYEMLIRRLESSLRVLQSDPIVDEELVSRVKSTKMNLMEALDHFKNSQQSLNTSSATTNKAFITSKLREDSDKSEVEESPDESKERQRIFLREDGTIDWDGAIASGREVAKFGTELFERLNGKSGKEGLPSIGELLSQAQERTPESEETKRLVAVVAGAKESLEKAQKELMAARTRLRDARKEGMEVTTSDLQGIRLLEARVKDEELKVKLFSLDLDMERICLFLEQELENSVEPPADQRLFVAEAALLDKQLSSVFSNVKSASDCDTLSTLIDPDELTLIGNQVTYLKSRLGIEGSSAREIDWGTIGKVVKEGLAKLKYDYSLHSYYFNCFSVKDFHSTEKARSFS